MSSYEDTDTMATNGEALLKTALAQAKSIPTLGQASRSVLRKSTTTRVVLSQVASLAWLLPIVTLLTMNFRGWIIGASVGCGFQKGKCDLDPFSSTAFEEAKRFDTRDHNILGALQFVAKALEVWFIIITVSLVYDLTMLFAVKGDGLPIGYLMLHREFSDILTLGERAFWVSANSPSRRRWGLYSLIGFVALLCITANLMGPATAVLVLPTLGWSEIRLHNGGAFNTTAASESPKKRRDRA